MICVLKSISHDIQSQQWRMRAHTKNSQPAKHEGRHTPSWFRKCQPAPTLAQSAVSAPGMHACTPAYIHNTIELNPTQPNSTQLNPTQLNPNQHSSYPDHPNPTQNQPNSAQLNPTQSSPTQHSPAQPNSTNSDKIQITPPQFSLLICSPTRFREPHLSFIHP